MEAIGKADASGLNINDMLTELRLRKWTLHLFGTNGAVDIYAACYNWKCDRSDVFILRSETSATSFRAIRYPKTDILNPELVEWQYHGPRHIRSAVCLFYPLPVSQAPHVLPRLRIPYAQSRSKREETLLPDERVPCKMTIGHGSEGGEMYG